MRRIRHGLLVIGLLGGLVVGVAAPAGAGVSPNWEVTDSLDGYVDVLVMSIENFATPCDDSGTVVNFVGEDDTVLASAPLSGANSGSVTVPDDLAETIFTMTVTCNIGGPFTDDVFDPEEEEPFVADYAGLDVTKVVEGDAPDDAEFVINVDCESEGGLPDVGPFDLTFGPTGGVDRVWFSNFHECDVTEPQAGGAVSTTIVTEDCDEGEGPIDDIEQAQTAELVEINGPVQCSATVTNVFDAATTTTPSSTTTTSTTAPGDAVAATNATAATPTVVNPTFTG